MSYVRSALKWHLKSGQLARYAQWNIVFQWAGRTEDDNFRDTSVQSLGSLVGAFLQLSVMRSLLL